MPLPVTPIPGAQRQSNYRQRQNTKNAEARALAARALAVIQAARKAGVVSEGISDAEALDRVAALLSGGAEPSEVHFAFPVL